MRSPAQPALTDAASGRVSMPFLPTVAVAIALGAASLYCPPSQPAGPAARPAEVLAEAPAPTAFAAPTALVPMPLVARLPAPLVFAEVYPLSAAPAQEASAARPAPARATPRLASAARRTCPGRRCPEPAQHGPDPLATARAEAREPAEDGLLPPLALPFAASVAETFAPAARVVGEAADLVRGGAATVTGSVALVADCLR